MNERAFRSLNGFVFSVSASLRASLLGVSLLAASFAGGCATDGQDDVVDQADQDDEEALDEESELLEARVVGSSRDSRPSSSSQRGGNPRVVGVTRDSSPSSSSRGGVGKVTRTEHDTGSSSRGRTVHDTGSSSRGRTVRWGSSSRR